MADNVLKVGAEFDVGPLIAGTKQASAAFKELGNDIQTQAARFAAQGLTVQENVSVLQNLGYSAKEAQAAVAGLSGAQETLAVSTAVATASMTGFERAAALAGGRILGMEAGLGMAGGALARVASYLPGLGTLFIYALPIALVSEIVSKIEEYELALQKADREMKEFAISAGEMSTSIEKENLELEDQILKLEKRPETNTLRIALIQAQEAAEKLSKGLSDSIEKANNLLSVGIGGELFSLLTGGGRGDEATYSKPIEAILDKIRDARLKLSELQNPTADQTNAGLKEQIELYKQLQTQLETAIRGFESGEGTSHIFAKSIANFKEELLGVNDAIKDLGSQEIQTNLIVDKGVEQNKVNMLDYWKQYSEGFAKVAGDLAKHDEFWKKFWADQVTEATRATAEESRIQEEGINKTAEAMSRINARETEINISNAKDEATHIEEINKKMAEDKEKALAGRGGIFATGIDTTLAKTQMVELESEIAKVNTVIAKLNDEMKAISSQAFISEADQKNLDRYDEQLKSLESLLQKLETDHAKLALTATTTWQQIQKAQDQAVTSGATTFNTQFVKMMETGQSFSRVMINTWNSMVASFVTAILKMGEQWIATELLKLETTTTTNTAITSQTLAQNLVQRFDNAKTAATKAMASVGFPLELAVGPLVFAAALAYQQGGIVPGVGNAGIPVIAHPEEMILPRNISLGLQQAIAGGSISNSSSSQRFNIENHFHGAGQVNEANVARMVKRAVKRGSLGR